MKFSRVDQGLQCRLVFPPSPRQTFACLFPLVLLCVLGSMSSLFGPWSEQTKALSSLRGRVAVIYAAPTFHEEVVLAFACMLKDLNYHTVVYIGNGAHVGGMMLPLSGRRKRGSLQFYGHCVSQWVSVDSATPLARPATDPDLLIFITYPMHNKGFTRDERALDLLNHHKQSRASSSVVLVTHRVSEMLHSMLPTIETLVMRNQLYFVFLGEHTMKAGLTAVATKGLKTRQVCWSSNSSAGCVPPYNVAKPLDPSVLNLKNTDSDKSSNPYDPLRGPYQLAHLFPIAPLSYITDRSPEAVPWLPWLLSKTMDPLATTLSELAAGEFQFSPPSFFEDRPAHAVVFGIQGNLGGKHAFRKDAKGAVSCIRGLQDELVRNHIGNTTLAARLGLDLIGHISYPFEAGQLSSSRVHIYNDLSSSDYYRQISRLTFMLPAVQDSGECRRCGVSLSAFLLLAIARHVLTISHTPSPYPLPNPRNKPSPQPPKYVILYRLSHGTRHLVRSRRPHHRSPSRHILQGPGHIPLPPRRPVAQ